MAEEKSATTEAAAPAAGAKEAAAAPAAGAFSRKGIMILGGIVVLEAVGFLAFMQFQGKGKAEAAPHAEEHDEGHGHAPREQDFEEYLKVHRAILDIGEVKVPIISTQPRAPRSVTATIHVVVNKELVEKLSGGGGGHGGGGKSNPQKDVLVLNIRSILRGMMDADGIRLIEPSAKGEFERKAKDRLNQVQIDGDEEKAHVLKVLRGQVLQVIIDKFDTQSY